MESGQVPIGLMAWGLALFVVCLVAFSSVDDSILDCEWFDSPHEARGCGIVWGVIHPPRLPDGRFVGHAYYECCGYYGCCFPSAGILVGLILAIAGLWGYRKTTGKE